MRAHTRATESTLMPQLSSGAVRLPTDRRLQQNRNGDVVIPADLGEIVLLPRLWDLDLVDDGAHGVLMRSETLAVEIEFDDGNAAVIDVHVEDLDLDVLQ